MTARRVLGSRLEATPSNDQGVVTDGGVQLVRVGRRSPKVAAKRARPRYAEARCVICGREVTVKAPSTSGAIQALYVHCVREEWRTLLLPKDWRGPRRVMVCRRCGGAIRPISRFMPARTAIQYDTW